MTKPADTRLTPQQLAERWQISRRTVYAMCAKGELESFRVGGQLRVLASVADRYEEANRTPLAVNPYNGAA